MRSIFWLVLLCFLPLASSAQEGLINRGPALPLQLSYAFQLPMGDLADRFGSSFNLGFGGDFLSARQNWILGLQGGFTFGYVVDEDVLAPMRTPEGFIYGNNKSVADVNLRQRGLRLIAHAGKLLSISPNNPRSAIRLTAGIGYWEHRIRLQEDPGNVVPQITGPYRPGYDRLTRGVALQQFIGYQFMSNDARINFFAGVELTEGFTRNRRAMNFDTGQTDHPQRFDMQMSFRVGWILPFYLGGGEEILY